MRFLIGFAMLGVVGVAQARSGDLLSPYVALSLTRDSNVFRLGDAVSPGQKRSDTLSSLSAGVAVEVSPGRQNLRLTLAKTLTRYDDFDQLDFDGEDYRFDWRWSLGNRLTGNLGVSRTVTQTSFTDFVFSTFSFAQFNNLVTRNRLSASGEWWFHPKWRARVNLSSGEILNSTTQFRSQNSRDSGGDAAVIYATSKGSQLQGLFSVREIEYINRTVSSFSQVDREYVQYDFAVLGSWAFSAKFAGRLRVGYSEREGKNIDVRDYSGLAYRAGLDYSPTVKTRLALSIFRELSGTEVDNANLRLIDGVSINGAWQINARFASRVGLDARRQNYRVESGLPTLAPRREEDIYALTGGLSYLMSDKIIFDLGLQAGKRNSGLMNADFDFYASTLSVRGDF